MRFKTATLIGYAGLYSWQMKGSLVVLLSLLRVMIAKAWAPVLAGLLVSIGLMTLAVEHQRLTRLKAGVLMVVTALSAVWLIYLRLS